MKKVALIVAGGQGKRMKSKIPKQFLLLNNTPVLIHTLKKFSDFNEIFLALPYSQFDYWKSLCKKHNFKDRHILIKGGETRFESVKNGLKEIHGEAIIAIHDGVRPIISKNLITQLITKAKRGVGIIPGLPLKDSIREINGVKSKHINRDNLYSVQTPQCFISSDIKNAYKQNYSNFFTDDASVFENNSGKIVLISGEEKNIKITTQEDLKIAESFMQ